MTDLEIARDGSFIAFGEWVDRKNARLVAIDLRDGRQRVLLDPNPSIRNLRLGKVQRLEWSTDKGLPVYGDLVLPPDYAGGRLPVIVTQYWSRGFLRGGTGNDYPIQLFAQAGFAVLSISRPPSAATADPALKDVVL